MFRSVPLAGLRSTFLGGSPQTLPYESADNRSNEGEPVTAPNICGLGSLLGWSIHPPAVVGEFISFGGVNELPPGFECNAPVEGCYSSTDQYWIIRPRAEFQCDAERGWLCIGGPGVDGIEFGVLREQEGVFAYYPIEGEYVWKAASATHLFTGWLSGEITV